MEIKGSWIKEQIDNHKVRRNEMIRLYNNYKGKNLAIESKEVSRTSKANNKIRSNYRKLIIDQKNGYLMGSPVQFFLDSMQYDDYKFQTYDNELKYFLLRNRMEDTLSETEKMSSICGYSVWLCYFDGSAKERFTELNPWDVIVIEDEKTGQRVGIYYYTVTITNAKGKKEYRTKAEVFTNLTQEFFITDEKDNFVRDIITEEEPILYHGFKSCPLVKVKNNEEEMSDLEIVEDTIEKLEFLLSSVQDEVDTFRMAYMLITGAELTSEQLELIKETGAFSGLEPEDKVEFITKNINDSFIENQKKTLINNIFTFASAIDMNDEKFSGGSESGESRKWKLIGLENKAKIKERKMDKAIRDLFEVICSSWVENKGLMINYLDIFYKFNRNLPVDLGYLADVSSYLKGMVSEETRLSVLSGLVDDVEWEKQKMKEENFGIKLDAYEEELMNPSEEEGE